MSEKPLQPSQQDKQTKPLSAEPLTKYKQIILYLATSLLASQLDLGVMADMLSILVNVYHLWQLVISCRADNA